MIEPWRALFEVPYLSLQPFNYFLANVSTGLPHLFLGIIRPIILATSSPLFLPLSTTGNRTTSPFLLLFIARENDGLGWKGKEKEGFLKDERNKKVGDRRKKKEKGRKIEN